MTKLEIDPKNEIEKTKEEAVGVRVSYLLN